MASLYKKVINGKPYWYLREMAWVDGKPKMVSERYLGSAADIAAALDARETAIRPERTRHLAFGDVAAAWGMLDRLGVIATIDEVVGARRRDAGASVGTYLALAALGRLVDPCSSSAFEKWWRTTAADRFTKISAGVLDHRKFWDAMHTVSPDQLARIEHRLAMGMVGAFGLDISALALDMTNFATYIDSPNDKAPIAARGKAKQKRADLRLVGLGLVITRDGGSHWSHTTYPGNRPDVTQFATMIDLLVARHTALAAALNSAPASTRETPQTPPQTTPPQTTPPQTTPPQITVVFDAGQNVSCQPRAPGRGRVGVRRVDPTVGLRGPAGPPGYRPTRRGPRPVPRRDRAGGPPPRLRRRSARRAHPLPVPAHRPDPRLRPDNGHGNREVVRAGRHPGPRSHPPSPPDQVTAEITHIVKDPWVRRVVSWQLSGDTPAEHRLSFDIDDAARTDLETEVFGKRVLMTDRDQWSTADVVAGYRSQSEAEFGFRSSKTPTSSRSARCTTGPNTTSACTSSPVYWLCRSPT